MTFFADEVEAVEFDSMPLGSTVGSAATTNPIKLSSPTTQNPRPQTNPANNTTVPANTNANNNPNVIIVGKTNNNPQPSGNNGNGGGGSIDSNVTSSPSYTNSTPNVNSTNTTTPVSSNNSNTTPTTTPTTTTQRPKPIQLNVKVLADNTANGWTNSGFHVKKGQKFRVFGRGQISLGGGNYAKPEGIKSLADDKKLLPAEATGGLIAVIGDDNNDFIFIGAAREFTATRDGMLFLGINENNLNDNSGSFEVTIEIEPLN